MRIACVYLPHFYFQVERLTNPAVEGHPVIIGCGRAGRETVIDCSEEAAADGVIPGMSVKEAYYRSPDALLLPVSDRYDSAWEMILFALGAFSLRVEPGTPGVAFLDITRVVTIFKDERTLALAVTREIADSSNLNARVGIGNSRFIAGQAARCAWDALIIAPREEKEFLALLPVEALPIGIKEKEHLRLLGLTTLKKVASLSRKALISQFGRLGDTIFEMVNGLDEKRPIPRRENPMCFEREFTGEVVLQTSGEIEAVMEGMVADLSGELKRMHMGARKIIITLWLQNGRTVERNLVMKKPSAEARNILARIADSLERLAVESPVISFRVAITDPVTSEEEQEGLFRTKSIFAERLDSIKSYFNALYGSTPIMKIEKVDEQSRLPERRYRFADL
jgi:nucleotidyltransferase/DNA polymerase involved in DNA repair